MTTVSKTKVIFLFLFLLIAAFNATNKTFANKLKTTMSDTIATGAYANVNGIKIYYEIHGEGKPLVLIHGGGSTIETSFGRILPLFAKHYKVIAVELQAHGHTSDRNAPVTFEQDADDVAALLKQLNIAKASVLGFSNGGSTAMQVAIRYPEVVDKLVIISAFYQRDGLMPGFFDMMQNASLENMPQQLKDEYLKINPDTAALRNMHDKDRARMLAFKNWSDSDLQRIKAPSLIICADKDVVLPEHAVKMWKLIPDAQLMILPGTHGSFIGEIVTAQPNSNIPAITVEVIKEFLEN